MTEETWYIATHVVDEPRPLAGGGVETFTVRGLSPGTTYYFGLMVGDEVPNWSNVSNIATGETASTAEVTIDLQAGWNMISVPVTPDDASAETLFPSASAVYTWNSDTRSYDRVSATNIVTTIEPGRGYWVAVDDPCAATIEGAPCIELTDHLLSGGWNMVGSICEETVAVADLSTNAPGTLQAESVYAWDPITQSFVPVSWIESGKGYWIAASEPCTLTIPSPSP
jgi:hypothetical protein